MRLNHEAIHYLPLLKFEAVDKRCPERMVLSSPNMFAPVTRPMWRICGLTTMPLAMLVSWCLGSSMWAGLPVLWYRIANPAAILLTLLSIGMLFLNNDRIYLKLCLISFVVLLAISFFPFWMEHIGEPTETETHWHNYWDMNHVH